MIECIFTIDYEIYGDGTGSLQELVYDPGVLLRNIFREWGVPLVVFVEAAELEKIEAYGADPAIDLIKRQVREFYRDGFEIGLHLHPQWCNATYEQGRWQLDYSEYNLCTLPTSRISEIVEQSCAYLRHLVNRPGFEPFSFRAGNWLFQPTAAAAAVLRDRGILLDSSVFKGGLQRNHRLDYRLARRNPYFWRFVTDANVSEPNGAMVEVPIFSEMVPFWEMCTRKRVGLQSRGGFASRTFAARVRRCLDLCRLRYPMKLDFCRMTVREMVGMFDRVIAAERRDPESYKPIVAIGHSKDLLDFDAIESFLRYLKQHAISVCTFSTVLDRVLPKTSEFAPR